MSELKIHKKKTNYTPKDVDFSSKQIDVLDSHLKNLVKENRLQGASYLISRDDKIFVNKSMGKLRAEKDDNRDLMPGSIRRVASVTKLFTSVAMMQLVEQGIIRIDQLVMEILEEFDKPLFNKVTIFHLLTHTSCIFPDPDAYFEPYPASWGWYNEEKWIEEILRGHTRLNLGKEWSYSSACFAILGEIISRKSGMLYEDYVAENILKPLGMEDSTFFVNDDLEDIEAIKIKFDRICFNREVSEQEIEKWIEDMKNRPKWAVPAAGGGLFSTLEDLQKFGQMLLNKGRYNNKQIISRKSVEAMTRNQLKDVKDYCWDAGGAEKEYGLGFRVHSNFHLLSPGTFSHEGAGLCGLFMDPVENIVFAYICPLVDEWVPEAVNNQVNIVWSGIL
ncbi:CubicO group peptidase (beta-lactamase class C family) [Orenia metallireducens]|uniref:CubicO group peptidase, beta-lactamase class C family n=1 Tax=Orenia metallireducens TaxID=1413210 RepID=A0A285I1J4_9FIRM|nr:serine hydrolase domain-containing protein [Orenia metallireducens]PRX29303.1 CubicO group peptidase (beta-lactamase class C family) [Orenia metallireducens]SNY40811.1 CubicO group peptidase, beta-lactamase class C family [Orenia metallireducens]